MFHSEQVTAKTAESPATGSSAQRVSPAVSATDAHVVFVKVFFKIQTPTSARPASGNWTTWVSESTDQPLVEFSKRSPSTHDRKTIEI